MEATNTSKTPFVVIDLSSSTTDVQLQKASPAIESPEKSCSGCHWYGCPTVPRSDDHELFEEEMGDEAIENNRPENHGMFHDANSGRTPKPYKLVCRTIRIGSFKIHPLNGRRHLHVLVSASGFSFEASKMSQGKRECVPISLKKEDILGVFGHLGRCLPVIFITTTPLCAARIRLQLGIVKGSLRYYDPESDDEKHKSIVFLIDDMSDRMRNYLRCIFPGGGVLEEIDQTQANKMLVRSTPNQGVPTFCID